MSDNKPPIEGKVLGKQVEYPSKYSPHILVAVPRKINREQYNIREENLPFIGYDIWHAYEVSFLTNNGLPVSGLLKIIYPSESPYIVESKSLKLYLNSFNMEKVGENVNDAIHKTQRIIKKDLDTLLHVNVEINLFINDTSTSSLFSDYQIIENLPNINKLQFTQFTDSPDLLTIEKEESFVLKAGTHLLRSNCKITHQPDWGSAFIYIKGLNKPQILSILQYIVSFRNENHFHEEICEMLFQRLNETYSPSELMVTCIYTRRGGIDICPIRATSKNLLPIQLTSPKHLTTKLLKQ